MKRKTPKYRHIVELIAIVAVVFVVNLIAGFKFFRIDLTEDKIHTLNDQTISFIESEVVNTVDIVIYLEGDDLPPSVQKFRQSLKDKLDEFQAYAGSNVKYKFLDINEDPELRPKYLETFSYNRVSGNQIMNFNQGASKLVDFYPIIEIRYNSNTVFVDFMPDMVPVSEGYVKDQANYIEYELLKGLYTATDQPKSTVSFLYGHGELTKQENSSAFLELKDSYIMDSVSLIVRDDSAGKEYVNFDALDKTDLLIIANPRETFTDFELLALDQYIMKGGKIVWSIDMVNSHEDSLLVPGKFFTYSAPNNTNTNLEKMLYKYGAGIKQNFITNKICAPQLRYDNREMWAWNKSYYDPQNNTAPVDPIIKQWYPFACVTKEDSKLMDNVGRVKLKYPSTININNGVNTKKTVLLETDYEFRIFQPITRIRYDDKIIVDNLLDIETSGSFFKPTNASPNKEPLAVMLEGEFESFFKNQIPDNFLQMLEEKGQPYKEKGKETSMMIVGDGDFLRNEIIYTVYQGKVVPQAINVGYDPFVTREFIYGNTTFLHNCIDKMTGNEYLIPLRSRITPVRNLNYDEIFYNRGKWQLINLFIPFIFVFAIGITQWLIRRKRYIS